jgi:hypothetical protein
MKKHNTILSLALLTAVIGTAKGQTATTLASGLNSPMKLALTSEGSLLVSEATVQLNTGRVSIVTRGGVRRTLLDGLPSGPAFPNGAPLGPSALALDGRTLYIGILEGNSLVAGPTPTSHPLANPDGPGSPIFSSILKVQLDADADRVMTGFSLGLDNQFTLADGLAVKLTNSDGQTASIDLLTQFVPTPLDRREVYGHVTPYGMALDPARQFLYIADAGQNRIIKVDVTTGRSETLVRFPRLTFGNAGAQTDPVPTSVRFYGDELLVTFLSGGPFPPGLAMVRIVNPVTREIRPFINLLTTATDLAQRDTPAGPQFFVVEYRSSLAGAPMSGRVIQFDSPVGRVIFDRLQGPTGMTQDPATGDLFVAEFEGGRITQIKPQ